MPATGKAAREVLHSLPSRSGGETGHPSRQCWLGEGREGPRGGVFLPRHGRRMPQHNQLWYALQLVQVHLTGWTWLPWGAQDRTPGLGVWQDTSQPQGKSKGAPRGKRHPMTREWQAPLGEGVWLQPSF